jgi:hypothetical protein
MKDSGGWPPFDALDVAVAIDLLVLKTFLLGLARMGRGEAKHAVAD